MNEIKIKDQFHYFNITSEIDSVYGNWAVSKGADVVNYLYLYAIMSIHLNDEDWLSKLKHKVWYKTEFEQHLKQALFRAKIVQE